MAFADFIEYPEETATLEEGQSVRWEEFVQGGGSRRGDGVFLNDIDVQTLNLWCSELPNAIIEALPDDSDVQRFLRTLVKVLDRITQNRHVVRYTVTLLLRILREDPLVAAPHCTTPEGELGVAPLLRLLDTSEDTYVLQKGSLCAAYLLRAQSDDAGFTSRFFAWVVMQLRRGEAAMIEAAAAMAAPPLSSSSTPAAAGESSTSSRQDELTSAGLEALMVVLRNPDTRSTLLVGGVVHRLLPFLALSNPQRMYQAAFCLWTLSLDEEGAREIERADRALTRLASAVRLHVVPVKVVRMAVATLRNVLTSRTLAPGTVPLLCETSLAEGLETILHNKRVTDEELLSDADKVKQILEENEHEFSPMDRYRRELDVKHLTWSSVHTAEFWMEHFMEFEKNQFALLKQVGALLDDRDVDGNPHTETIPHGTRAVACFDLGEFAANHPQGKAICMRMGLKEKVLRMLDENDPSLRRHALLALSKMMVSKWQFLDVASEGLGEANQGRTR